MLRCAISNTSCCCCLSLSNPVFLCCTYTFLVAHSPLQAGDPRNTPPPPAAPPTCWGAAAAAASPRQMSVLQDMWQLCADMAQLHQDLLQPALNACARQLILPEVKVGGLTSGQGAGWSGHVVRMSHHHAHRAKVQKQGKGTQVPTLNTLKHAAPAGLQLLQTVTSPSAQPDGPPLLSLPNMPPNTCVQVPQRTLRMRPAWQPACAVLNLDCSMPAHAALSHCCAESVSAHTWHWS